MFNSLVIRQPKDFGQTIESLFFYKQTHLHIGRPQIKALFDLADIEVLEELFRLPGLSVYFNNSHAGIAMENDIKFVDSFELSSLDIEKELFEASYEHRQDSLKSKKFSKKLSRLIEVYQLPKNFNLVMNDQLKDIAFRKKILIETLKFYLPLLEIPEDKLIYEIEYLSETNFRIHSNLIDLGISEQMFTNDTPVLSIITALEDLQVMTDLSSEICLPELKSKIIRSKIDSVLDQSMKSNREIEVFNHFTFYNSWALREAVNSKQVHVKAILRVLRKSEKYKEWLHQIPDNHNLIDEYVQKVKQKNILEKFPAKAIRFYLCNGISAILGELNPELGMSTSLVLNTFNDLILDNILKKWSPSQFVEGELRGLLDKNENAEK